MEHRSRQTELCECATVELRPQSKNMYVLQSLSDPNGKVIVTIVTNAHGMGVDIKGLYNVIHYGPPSDLEFNMQEMGRAGRDGKYSKALLLFHGRQLRQCKPEMLDYVKSNSCRKRKLVDFFEDKGQGNLAKKKHLCCDVCALECRCGEDCPQNNGSMLSKISLSNGGGDI